LTYDVSATFFHAGKVFASPFATVAADTPATIKASGDDGFTLAFIVIRLTQDTIQVVANNFLSWTPLRAAAQVNGQVRLPGHFFNSGDKQ